LVSARRTQNALCTGIVCEWIYVVPPQIPLERQNWEISHDTARQWNAVGMILQLLQQCRGSCEEYWGEGDLLTPPVQTISRSPPSPCYWKTGHHGAGVQDPLPVIGEYGKKSNRTPHFVIACGADRAILAIA
jgi:hypothetical protein